MRYDSRRHPTDRHHNKCGNNETIPLLLSSSNQLSLDQRKVRVVEQDNNVGGSINNKESTHYSRISDQQQSILLFDDWFTSKNNINFIFKYILRMTNEHGTRCFSSPYTFIFGQILAFLLASANATQASLSIKCNISIPTISVGLVYCCLSFCLIPVYFESKKQQQNVIINNEQEEVEEKQGDDGEKISYEQKEIVIEMTEEIHNHQQRYHPNDSSKYLRHNVEDSNNDNIAYEKVDGLLHLSNPSSNNTHGDNENDYNDNYNNDGGLLDLQQQHGLGQSSAKMEKPYRFLFGCLRLAVPGYRYIIIGLLDFYANYCTVLAFKYTTITSITLLDALAIPTAMILSRIFLKRQYTNYHFFGICLCILGIAINVLHDAHHPDDTNANDDNNPLTEDYDILMNGTPPEIQYPYRLYGDMLAITGGTLIGAVNVIGEMIIRDYGGPNEYNGMIGFWAMFICFLHGSLWERDEILTLINIITSSFSSSSESTTETLLFGQCHPIDSLLLLMTFVFVTLCIYLGASRFLLYSESAFLNLNLLTADMWSVLFSIISLHIIPQPIFYVALCITVLGVATYEVAPSPIIIIDNDDNNCQYHTTTNHDDDDDDDNDNTNNTSEMIAAVNAEETVSEGLL